MREKTHGKKEMNKLYTDKENEELKERLSELSEKDKEPTLPDLDKATSEGIPKGEFKLFTLNKVKLSYDFNRSLLMPSKLTLIGKGSFSDRYRKQLNAIIYNSNETMDVEALIEISVLWSYVADDLYPIQLKMTGYKQKRHEIIGVLNEFFYYNKIVLGNIHRMMRDTINTNPEALRNTP